MAKDKLQSIYEKKKRLLDEAEIKVRYALHQTRHEADMEGAVLIRLHQMQNLLVDVAKDVDLIKHTKDKPSAHEHLAAGIRENLRKMNVLRHEAAVIVKGVKDYKKKGYKNVRALQRDFKHISVLREKMDKHLS